MSIMGAKVQCSPAEVASSAATRAARSCALRRPGRSQRQWHREDRAVAMRPRPWQTTTEYRGAILRRLPSAAWPAARRPPRADRSPPGRRARDPVRRRRQLRIQRLAAAAGALHELADLLVQRHLLEQRFGTGEILRDRHGLRRTERRRQGRPLDTWRLGLDKRNTPSMRWLESTRSRRAVPLESRQSNLARMRHIRMCLAGACAVLGGWASPRRRSRSRPRARRFRAPICRGSRRRASPRKPRPWSSSRSTAARSAGRPTRTSR